MKSAILISGILIAEAISNVANIEFYSDKSAAPIFLGIVLLVFLIDDGVEIINRNMG